MGGDFFQYFPRVDDLTLVLADATGHAMEAAIPIVLFDGVLESQMLQETDLKTRVERLNTVLHRLMKRRTFVCMVMGELVPASRRLRLVNAGCPYPYHFRAAEGTVHQLELGGYPLGALAASAYKVEEVVLAPGDRMVFCSDGLDEARNNAGQMYSFERLAEVVRQGCQAGLSAKGLVDQIFDSVAKFAATTELTDDQTVVVLAVED